MGIGHSRASETNGSSLQNRRRCFWCQNGRSFDDFYEPATATTATDCNDNERSNVQKYGNYCDNMSQGTWSKSGRSSEEAVASSAGPLMTINEPLGAANQIQPKTMSANCDRRPRDDTDTADNLLPYSHFTHDTLMQIIRCFPFPSPRSSPERSPFSSGRSPSRSRSFNVQQSGRPPRVGRSCSVNDGKKCVSTKSAPTVGPSDNKSCQYKMAAVTVETQKSAIQQLALVSADTMAITALPLDCWLKERLKSWVQLSGHQGTIVPATDQTLWKRRSCSNYNEAIAYRALMEDSALDGFVPRYYREVQYKNESFIEIEDLTALFDDPAIMDIKMGTRTFLESEVQNTSKRNDLYEKMIAIKPNEPTEEEHAAKAITKMRYMQFREKESSSATLGFRIEAAKMPGGILQKSFKKVKTREDVRQTLLAFFGEQTQTVVTHILQRLKNLREAVQKSLFFSTHEVIGSSLLFIYDSSDANVWMIDFAKSIPVEKDSLNHRREWVYGNHEDGYFKGLDNLIETIRSGIDRSSFDLIASSMEKLMKLQSIAFQIMEELMLR